MASLKLSSKDKQFFKKNGYLVIKSRPLLGLKLRLKKELLDIALKILRKDDLLGKRAASVSSLNFDRVFDWCVQNERNNSVTRAFYEIFPASLPVIGLIGDRLFVDYSKQLNLSHPLPSTLPILRIDRPKEMKYLTPAHQDFWYSMLSPNSLTFWFPLLPVTEGMGDLLVIPGSQRSGLIPVKGYTPENPFTSENDFLDSDFIPVRLKEDEMLVFSQYLVHKSGLNKGDRARLTIQIRYNDLETLKTLTSSFTPQYSRYVHNIHRRWQDELAKLTAASV